MEEALSCGRLHELQNLALLTDINCALHAHVLLQRDVDYLVKDGRIGVIDELTGRVVPDRHWPDGLQAALEAKEGLTRQADGRILGSIALQHFLRGYTRLCGMTGTARTAAAELFQQLRSARGRHPHSSPQRSYRWPDVLFSNRSAKERAVVEEVRRVHASGRRRILVVR